MLNDDELLSVVKDLKALKHEAADLAAKASQLEDDIKREMTLRNIDILVLDAFKIHYKEYDFEKFDKKGFKDAYGELYSKFSKIEKGKRLIIT